MKTTEMTTPLETIKTPLGASEKEKQGGSSQEVFDALRKAFNLGKDYELAAFPEEYEREFREFQKEFSSRFD